MPEEGRGELGAEQGDVGNTDAPAPLQKEGRQNQSLDLLALAELMHVVRPKFRFKGGFEQPCNLFNTLIKNDSAQEREAMAHESNVLIPAACSFFLADMSNFRLLLKGEPL